MKNTSSNDANLKMTKQDGNYVFTSKVNYKNNDLVGINQILIGDKLLYEENIYIEKNKKESKNIFNKIRKWFND